MIRRFEGPVGKAHLVEELKRQRACNGVDGLAENIAAIGKLVPVRGGEVLIPQGAVENDVHFILAGCFHVLINQTHVVSRGPGDHVGEMAAIVPIQARSADVIATEESLVLTLTGEEFLEIAAKYPAIWRGLARELVSRLDQRSRLIRKPNSTPRVFIISSSEALPVARALEANVVADPLTIVVWKDNVFRIADYNLESLERELEQADFAIAIASGDDLTISRKKKSPSPRDNIIFEIGFFMGRLGRKRAILMVPEGDKIKLPSDFLGLTTLPYDFVGLDGGAEFASTCNRIREHIKALRTL